MPQREGVTVRKALRAPSSRPFAQSRITSVYTVSKAFVSSVKTPAPKREVGVGPGPRGGPAA